MILKMLISIKGIKMKKTILLLVLFLFPGVAEAQSVDNAQNLLKQSSNRVEFIENKGQIVDQNGKANRDVLFIANVPGGAIYVRRDGISYAIIKCDSVLQSKQMMKLRDRRHNFTLHDEIPEPVPMEIYRVDMQFNNSLQQPKVTGLEVLNDYDNYYLTQCPEGITNVRKFKRVYYENIYNNIDFVLYVNHEGKTQYDFIVKPGGNPSVVNFAFKGAEGIETLPDGSLRVVTPFGNIEQAAPYSYQSQVVKSSFKLNMDNSVSFQVGAFDKAQTLIIDPPTRLWGTYYGAMYWNGYYDGNSVDGDGNDNVYLCGSTRLTTGLATTGAHQTLHGGDLDAFLVKFNSSGARLWGTYYGGSDRDEGHGVAVDRTGNVYIAGYTNSTNAISTPGAHQVNFGGSVDLKGDAFLVKFNSSGMRLWGTYYGGINGDRGRNVAVDSNDNVYLCGSTNSGNAIATPGAHRTNYGNGFLVKFNSRGVRIWGTYYGGRGFRVSVDRLSNVYLCGDAEQPCDGIATPGAHQTYYGGGNWDAYLVKFNSNGIRLWGTYYGGDEDDFGDDVTTDSSGNVYLCGRAVSRYAIATPGAFRTTGYGGFLAKFNSSGVRQWGTYCGYYAEGVATDSTGNIYLCGTTSTVESDTIATPEAHQADLGGGAFLAKFDSSGARIWGTYYGGKKGTLGTGLHINSLGNIYICGTTQSSDAIATPGAYQENLIDKEDPFLVKFSQDYYIYTLSVSSDSACPNSVVLVPFTAIGAYFAGNIFSAQLSDSIGSFKNPTIIGTLADTVSGTIVATIPSDIPYGSGYRIRVVSSSPTENGCKNNTNILINTITAKINGYRKFCCSNSNYIYETLSDPNLTYHWSAVNGTVAGSDTDRHVNIRWGSPGAAKIKIVITNSITGCKDTLEKDLTIDPLPVATILGDTLNCCANDIKQYETASGTNLSYQWLISGGIVQGSSTQNKVNVLWNKAVTGKAKVIVSHSITGCVDSLERTVLVKPTPFIDIQGNSAVQQNANETYTSTNSSGVIYSWIVENGTTIGATNEKACQVKWTNLGSGKVILKLKDSNSICANYDTLNINITTDIPALAANGGGNKDFCSGLSVQIGSTNPASGGVPPYTFLWTPSTGLSNDAIANPVASPDVTTQYTITVYDSRSVIATDKITVTVDPLPNKPIISYDNHALVSNYSTGNQWYYKGDLIASATSQKYLPTVNGKYQVRYTDENGCQSPLSDAEDYIVKVYESINSNSIKIYPNPAESTLNIEFIVPIKGARIKLLDLLGSEMFSRDLTNSETTGKFTVNIENLSSGLYYLIIQLSGKYYLEKIIVE